MTQYGAVLFHTTSAVMRAKKLLEGEGYVIKLIPTPREFSSDCGIALRFEWKRHEQVKAVFDAACLEFDQIQPLA
jgi:hypothetical protein